MYICNHVCTDTHVCRLCAKLFRHRNAWSVTIHYDMAMKIGKIFDNRVFNKWRKQKLNTLRLNLLQSKVARVAVAIYR